MVVHILAVGKVKDRALREACSGFAQRVRRHQKLRIVEVRGAGLTEHDTTRARHVEARSLLGAVPERARLFALTRLGAAETSEAFARRLQEWRETARDVALIIGGAFGLDDAVLDRCETRIGLSPMTLPHEMARLLLLEQLYRADTILRGEPYHKGVV